MKKAVVKWFNNAKGYGFVYAVDKPTEDIFVHFSNIKMEGYKTLKANQEVMCEFEQTDNGLHATKIEFVEDNGNREFS